MISLLGLMVTAEAQQLTILHTNDWQSRLLGFGPNSAYSPQTTGDDDTIGGIARLAALIETRRSAAEGPVVLLDGGDITMGSLFHTVARQTGAELQLMSMIGYDAVTLGNHEFDFRPDGLADMIEAARAGKGCPPIVATNLVFSDTHPGDDRLAALAEVGAILPWMLIERGGVRIGLIGVLGEEGYEVIGQAEPVTISDPISTIRQTAQLLRGEQDADIVLLMSHSGVKEVDDDPLGWGGEEVEFAREISEIDAVIGGHSHTPLHEPIMVEGRPVVQAGSDGRFLGELVLERAGEGWQVASYTLHSIDDTTLGDPAVSVFIDSIKEIVTAQVLQPEGYTFSQPLAETPVHLKRSFESHTLGNHVTDAFRVAAGADMAFTGNGTIRDDLRPGVQWVSDLFRISALGIGVVDESPGYPLMKMFMTGEDLKSAVEFLLVGYQLKGDSYYPRLSGAQVTYNNHRVMFDRVVQIQLGDDASGYSQTAELTDDALYSVAVTSYIAGFFPTVKETSFGLLSVTPRDADGDPVTDLSTLLLDANPSRPGVQEVKAWRALFEHLSSFPDTDSDGVADIPHEGLVSEVRLVRVDSWAPSALLANATWKMAAYVGALPGLLTLIGGGLWWRRRRRKR
ncbi:MAG: 5'-nucleotidase/UDP-sugar diphosphatase [Myxococcota bacterium]|jgi:5'-nucleotidase/UDP-sugar diphosphatase